MCRESEFIYVPTYYIVPDRKGHWLSSDELWYYSKYLGKVIKVPAYTVNDLASIPVFFRRVFEINGPSRPAAALHDYLYEVKGYLADLDITLTRHECDLIFKEAMAVISISYWDTYPRHVQAILREKGLSEGFSEVPLCDFWTTNFMYIGVYLGGAIAFNKSK